MTDPELVLVGAAGTGKTLATLRKINDIAWQYPKVRILIARKVRADLAQSTLVTFERDILGFDNPICAAVQREHRQVYRYPNGSEIVVGGMDRPGRFLSAEYDFIYAAEAVQFSLEDWETFGMRLARAPRMPYSQLLGDTNPDRPDHWLKQRADAGVTVMLNTFHTDNPLLWNGTDWTPIGRNYVLGRLNRLTGVRKARYLEGKWVLAEGAIFEEWNDAIHVIDPFDIPSHWTRFRSIDFGYSNPFVCLWIAVDPDGRLYIYREIYKTQRIVEDHAKDIKRLSTNETIAFTVADHDAEDRATLSAHGIETRPADKAVSVGIQNTQSRLRKSDDGKPRLFIFRGSLVEYDFELAEAKRPTRLIEEMPGYVWANNTKKEQPVKKNDHAIDALRYAVQAIDGRAHTVTVVRQARVKGRG